MHQLANIFEGADAQTMAAQCSWYAVQTRSRHEKKLLLQLEYHGFTSFLPLVNRVSRWSDRTRTVQEPLFSGYLFVRLAWSAESRTAVLKNAGAVALVGARGLGIPIPEKQIADIRTLLAHNIEWSAYPFLRIGDRVRIRGGALDGVEGVLLGHSNNDETLVISVHAIQRSLAIRVKGYDLEKI